MRTAALSSKWELLELVGSIAIVSTNFEGVSEGVKEQQEGQKKGQGCVGSEERW